MSNQRRKLNPSEQILLLSQVNRLCPRCRPTQCENNLWPNVAVVVSNAEERSTISLRVAAETDSGDMIEASPFSECPSFGAIACDFTFYTNPMIDTIQLIADLDGVHGDSASIKLAPFNRCGLNMAYVTLNISNEGLEFLEPSFISPCRRL